MTNAADLTVAVESSIHRALSDALHQIWRDHGIRVAQVRADWLDVSAVGRCDFILSKVYIESETFPTRPR